MLILKILLCLLAVIFALILFLLTQKIKLCITYGEDMSVVAKLLFFKYRLYPIEKKSKNKKRKKTKPKKKKASATGSKQATGSKPKKSILDTISFVTTLIRELISHFKKALSVDINKVIITLGGADDAALAAIEYGAVCVSAQTLLALADNFPDRVKVNSTPVVDIDYLSKKSGFELDIVINIGIFRALSALLHTAIMYITSK